MNFKINKNKFDLIEYKPDSNLLLYLKYYNISEVHSKIDTIPNAFDIDLYFCDAINKLWMNPINFLKLYGDNIIDKLNHYKKENIINDKNYADAMRFITEYKNKLIYLAKRISDIRILAGLHFPSDRDFAWWLVDRMF